MAPAITSTWPWPRLGFRRDWLAVRAAQARDLALTLRDADPGREHLQAALRTVPADSLPPADRPYLALAEAYAVIGDTSAAASAIRGWEQTPAARYRPGQAAGARGWLALARDRPREAVNHFRTVVEQANCAICGWAELGHAYDRARMPDSAMVAFERFLETPQMDRIGIDAGLLGRALESLAALHAAAGQPDEAARYYGRLIELWEDADPALQPRVEAARSRLAALVERRG